MTFQRKHLYIALSAAVAVAGVGTKLAVSDFTNSPISAANAADAPAPAPEVDVANVVAATITEYQNYSGRMEAIDDVDVRPLVPGTIVAVHFKDGALVKKGDPLFTIDPRLYQAAVDRAAADVAAAQSRVSMTATDFGRAQRLVSQEAVSRRDYDVAENASRVAVASLKVAQAELDTAKVNLSYTEVVAPVTGRVSRAELTVGNVVSVGASAPVLTKILSVSPIYASFQVDEQTYLRYLSRQNKSEIPVSLGLADETGFSQTGKVDSVDNRLDGSSGTIRVRARFENADGRLVPGLYARIKVGGGFPRPALMVDDAAIGTDQEKKFVMVVDKDNRAHYREVALGAMHDGMRIVEKGVEAGDRIVVNGLQRVQPEELVKVNQVAMAGALTQVAAAPKPKS